MEDFKGIFIPNKVKIYHLSKDYLLHNVKHHSEYDVKFNNTMTLE